MRSHTLRCPTCNKYTPDRCTCKMQARRFCQGDGEWSEWRPISNEEHAERKGDSTFQFRATKDTP